MSYNTAHNFNRKIHIHVGLCLLFFIWLFSFTGLLLNHNGWKFASFWDERKEITYNFTLPVSMRDASLQESAIMDFLKITGEVQEQKRFDQTLSFRVMSPGDIMDINVNWTTGEGKEKRMKFNMWGKLRTMHTFNGMHNERPAQTPNWWITGIWRFTMDVIAIGFIVMTLSSWIMWYKIRKEYPWGYVIMIGAIVLICYFVFS